MRYQDCQLAISYPIGYYFFINNLIRSTEFNQWLDKLRDARAKARIVARLISAQHDNFGDCKPVGEGVSEMRIDIGAGYRVYYTRQGLVVYFLLMGGSKSTQKQDIKQAIQMARQLKE